MIEIFSTRFTFDRRLFTFHSSRPAVLRPWAVFSDILRLWAVGRWLDIAVRRCKLKNRKKYEFSYLNLNFFRPRTTFLYTRNVPRFYRQDSDTALTKNKFFVSCFAYLCFFLDFKNFFRMFGYLFFGR